MTLQARPSDFTAAGDLSTLASLGKMLSSISTGDGDGAVM